MKTIRQIIGWIMLIVVYFGMIVHMGDIYGIPGALIGIFLPFIGILASLFITMLTSISGFIVTIIWIVVALSLISEE